MVRRDELRRRLAQAIGRYGYSIQTDDFIGAESWRESTLKAMSRLNEFDLIKIRAGNNPAQKAP